MPELAKPGLGMRNSAFSSKSAGLPPRQIRKVLLLAGIFLGGLAGDRAVLDTPELRVRRPSRGASCRRRSGGNRHSRHSASAARAANGQTAAGNNARAAIATPNNRVRHFMVTSSFTFLVMGS